MSNWFKKHLAVRLDSHTLGNLVKNASPALAFTPAGLLGVAGASALGDVARGKHNVLDIAKGAVGNVAIGTGLHAGVGALRNAASGAGSASTSAAGGAVPSATGVPLSPIQAGAGGVPASVTAARDVVDALPSEGSPFSAFSSAAKGAGKKALSFVGQHPQASAMALQAAGNLSTSGSENRLRNAEADVLEQKSGETRYDFEKRKAREAALAPIWSALGTSVAGGYNDVAANPYRTAVA